MKGLVKTFTLMAVCLIVIFLSTGKLEANEKVSEINLSVFPKKELFKIENMKPGDWMTRSLVIRNEGKSDLNYETKAKYVSGSKKLYNQLLLKVLIKDEILFEGKLSEFNGLEQRPLAQSKKEELTFTIEFPSESGNEFQGLETKVSFQFSSKKLLNEATTPVSEETPKSRFGSVLPTTGNFISPIVFYVGGMLLFTMGTVMFLAKRGKLSFHFLSRGKDL